MKILYAGGLRAGSSAPARGLALERQGHEMIRFDVTPYDKNQPELLRKISFRLVAGPAVNRLNRDLLALAEKHKPDIFWADKVLSLQPSTLKRMRELGIVTVSYMIDNFFGPRKDPGWRLYKKNIPLFDLHATQRDSNLPQYMDAGARNVVKIQTAYEPTLHYPPPPGWSDANRNREVSFVGTPYDERAGFLTKLYEAGIPISVSGRNSQWARALTPEAFSKIHTSGLLYDDAYREAIWLSKINLSFLTRSNLDEFTQKSFEVAGAGGFLLAERTDGHMARFVEGEEAVFFSSLEECIAVINRYLPDEAARTRIAAAGHERAKRDGYHNDRQVAIILEKVKEIMDKAKAKA